MPSCELLSQKWLKYGKMSSTADEFLKKGHVMIWLILVLIVIILVYLVWDNMVFDKIYYDIKIPHLDKKLSGLKICHISDLHLPHHRVNLKKLTQVIKEENPDVIIISGDIFSDEIDRDNQNNIRYIGQSMGEVAPIYAIAGNRDLPYMQGDKWRKTLENNGIKVLLDEVDVIKQNGEELVLIGLAETQEMNDYEVVPENRSFMENIKLKDQYNDKSKILIAHHPEFFEQYIANSSIDFDLVLSGHTHGGQVRLPFIGGVYAPGQGFNPYYDYGIFHSKNDPGKRLIINRGLSTKAMTFRVFNRMEVSFIVLH